MGTLICPWDGDLSVESRETDLPPLLFPPGLWFPSPAHEISNFRP
jgi:hypothetical protein